MGSVRSFEIDKLRDKYNLEFFVETGTLYGDGIDFALANGFEKIFSIEIEKSLCEASRAKYITNNNVKIVHGDSVVELPGLLPSVTGNALFWFDAHFPGADIGIKTYRSCLELDYNTRLPLESDLTAISNRSSNYRDVIIADDMCIYEEGEYGFGNFNDHMKNHGYNVTKEEMCGKRIIPFIEEKFGDTHELKTFRQQQGYIVLLPR